MSNDTSPIPEGYHSVTTSLTIKGAAEALDFYKKAFGAIEKYRLPGPNGEIMHAEFTIGDTLIMLSDEFPDWGALSPDSIGGCPVTLMIYVPDVDAAHEKALAAGATETYPIMDQFWGDRSGGLKDPFGFKWSLATRRENLTPQQIKDRFENWMKNSNGCG